MEWFDVIVVGAGPAGSTAAWHLAKAGINTLVLDKSKFPREKPCGNFVAGTAIKHLEFALPEEIIRGICRGGYIRITKEKQIHFRMPFEVGKFVVRSDLDSFLLNKAISCGARALLERGVATIRHHESSGVEVFLTSGEKFSSPLLIGADGATGNTWKLVRPRKFRRWELGIAAYTMVPSVASSSHPIKQDEVLIDFTAVPGSYAWNFPQGDFCNIGIVGSALRLKKPKTYLRDFLGQEGYASHSPLKAHPVPAGGVPRGIAHGRVVLVGDAAGFVDTVSGDGISNAIFSGTLAARAALAVITQRRFEYFGNTYVSLVRDSMLKDLRAALFFSIGLQLLQPLFCGLKEEYLKTIFKKYFEVVAGRLDYRAFVSGTLWRLPLFSVKSLLA